SEQRLHLFAFLPQLFELALQFALREETRARSDADRIARPLQIANRDERQRRVILALDAERRPECSPLHPAIRIAQPPLPRFRPRPHTKRRRGLKAPHHLRERHLHISIESALAKENRRREMR